MDFLRTGINRLADDYEDGKQLEGFPEFQFITLKKSRRGQGHYVIYKVDQAQNVVKVLRVYHTRMDVQGQIESGIRIMAIELLESQDMGSTSALSDRFGGRSQSST